jgi:hypothetical protein
MPGGADFVELLRCPLADGIHVGLGMALVDGDELRTEQPNDGTLIYSSCAYSFTIDP